MNRFSQRILVGLLGAGAGLLLATGSAQAAPATVTATPSAADLSAARQAADTPAVHTALSGFFADRGHPAATTAAARSARAAKAAAMAPKLTGATVAIYYLNPDFVKSPSAPVASLAYLSTEAVSTDGQHAAVWTVKQHDVWTEINIASGSDENTFVAKAGPGAVTFREPQVNAWYAVRDGRVTPLNPTARTEVGSGVSLATYQRFVHKRYGDKMAGSEYARKHTLGGYEPKPVAATVSTPARHSSNTAVEIGMTLGVVALLGAAGGLVLRRRSRQPAN